MHTCWCKWRRGWRAAKQMSLAALSCLVFYEWAFSHSFPKQAVHRALRSRCVVKQARKRLLQDGSAPQARPTWDFKLDQLDTNNMVVASSGKAASAATKKTVKASRLLERGTGKKWKSPEPPLIKSNWKPKRLQLLGPLGCVGMKRQDPESPVTPVFGPCHISDVVECPWRNWEPRRVQNPWVCPGGTENWDKTALSSHFLLATMKFCYHEHIPLLLWSDASAQFLHSEHQRRWRWKKSCKGLSDYVVLLITSTTPPNIVQW